MKTTTFIFVMLFPATCLTGSEAVDDSTKPKTENMVHVAGGMFQMGDVFDEGVRLAAPVHEVTVASFYLNKYEVTVEEFAAFVKDAGYVTAAERGHTRTARLEKAPPPRTKAEYEARLASGGAFIIDPTLHETSWGLTASWRNPFYAQSPQDPVVCVSWTDAANYCNWLSEKEGLPVAHDIKTGHLLDAHGQPTTDVTKVRGYRLPTEAEWEYAARERGKKIRFGNGQNIARPAEMNFNAAAGNFAFAKKGELRGKTVPVGSFKPNSLGLYDMSGNVWEWCSDFLGLYSEGPRTNPYQDKSMMDQRRAARDGPWAGDASWARASARMGWVADDRCNNIGFRVARSQ